MQTTIKTPKNKTKTQIEIMNEFDKWIEKIQNVHRGIIQKMGDAYERLLTN